MADTKPTETFKPGPPINVEFAWAKTRQALCDALPWFKSHQGSLYTSDKVAKGLLIDSGQGVRDGMVPEIKGGVTTPQVIIAALGGGREQVDGARVRSRNPNGRNARYCKARMDQGLPIGVVIGHKYPGAQVDAQVSYRVLGWFTITDLWAEKDNGFIMDKIRLELTEKGDESPPAPDDERPPKRTRLEPTKFPHVHRECGTCAATSSQWFAAGWTCLNGNCSEHFAFEEELGDTQYPYHPDSLTTTYASDRMTTPAWCISCRQMSKSIFEQGWTCLNKECPEVFTFGPEVDTSGLTYCQEFWDERTDCTRPDEPLIPPAPEITSDNHGTEVEFRGGIVCPECRACMRRCHWAKWECEQGDCDYSLPSIPTSYHLASVHNEEAELKRSTKSNINVASCLHVEIFETEKHEITRFLLPCPRGTDKYIGTVSIYRPKGDGKHGDVRAEDHGPDQLWETFQNDIVKDEFFKRNPVYLPNNINEKLTRNFQKNWGAPYKFVVDVTSSPFSEAPNSVLKSLVRMRWAGGHSVSSGLKQFPAEGEEAGPTYAAPSSAPDLDKPPVGAFAETFKKESQDFVEFNELLALGYMEGDEISYHDDGEDTLGPTVATLSLGSPAVMSFRVKPKFLESGKTKVVLRFPIYHGDMVVMHGTAIHQNYDHHVKPHGNRRFALTSRNIVPTKIAEEVRQQAMKKGTVPEAVEQWAYSG